MSEHDLVTAIHRKPAGEAEWRAWHQLVYPRLYYAAFRLSGGNVDRARDLTQDTFARFLRYNGIKRVTSDASSVAYLIQICRNIAASRYEPPQEISLDDMEVTFSNLASETRGDLQLLVRQVLDDLQPEDRRLMQWALDGFSLTEISGKLGITYSAAGVRLHRLKNFIRKRLGL